MSTFLYFFPGPDVRASRAFFGSLGLDYALPDAGEPSWRGIKTGPDGGPGKIATVGMEEMLAYDAEKQLWRKGPEGKFWVGMFKDNRPTPTTLARKRVFDGDSVRLLDGNEWVIPRAIAILPGRHRSLPKQFTLHDDGKTVLISPYERFEALSADTFRFFMEWSRQVTEKEKLMTAAERLDLAIEALGVNYMMGRVEAIGLLKLLGELELADILQCLVDARAAEEYMRTMEVDQAAGLEKNA